MAKRLRIQLILLLYCFFWLIFFPSLHRAEAAKMGRSKLMTDIFVGEIYDDNVSLTKHHKKSDRISTIIPVVSLSRSNSKISLNLSYKAHIKIYDKDPNENQYQQTGSWDMDLKPTKKSTLGLRGKDIYSYIQRDVREPLVASKDNVIKRNDFSVTPYLKQKIGKKLKTYFSYTYTERKYKGENFIDGNSRIEDPDFEDSDSQSGTFDIQYKLGNTIWLNGGYKFISTDFSEETPDYTEQSSDGGVTWDVMSKIKLKARYGRAWKKDKLNRKTNHSTVNSSLNIYSLKNMILSAAYTRSSSYNSSRDTENDYFISHNTSLNIEHDFLNRKISLNYGCAYNVADYEAKDRKDKSYSANTRLAWKMSKRTLFSLTGHYAKTQYLYDSKDNDPTKREDISCRCGASLDWKILKSTTLSLDGIYTKADYAPEGREDKLFNGGVKMASRLNKNIFFEAGYQYSEKTSNIDKEDNEYIDNKYTLGLRIVF